MTVCSNIADYEWLTGDEACVMLNDLATVAAPLHTTVAWLRGRLSAERAHLVVEQVDLRRRAATKFTKAAQMFFTRVGLEQATDEWIAEYKASRFAIRRAESSSALVIADLCCGIGGDLLPFAGRGIGVDWNPVAAHFAAVNTGASIHAADAAGFDVRDFSAWHIDPDRRTAGARTTSLRFCQPDIAVIERLLLLRPHAAIKLAPAAKVPDEWAGHCELEWISRDRECRQLVAWHGDLARAPGRRAATAMSAARNFVPRTITGAAGQPIAVADRVGQYVFDVDPAVLAAGLQGAFAVEHCLSALAAGSTYLTGPLAVDDAALACFAVADVLPMKRRQLADYLRQRSIGRLEIKKRGVEIDPEQLHRDLKLRGDNAATLLVARVAGRPAAIIARRIAPTPSRPAEPLLESTLSRSISP